MQIKKEKYMNTALVILQGLLASGKYNEVDFERKSTGWDYDPVCDALGITDHFFNFSDSCQVDDDFFEVNDL